MRSIHVCAAALLVAGLAACSTLARSPGAPATWADIVALPAASAGQRIAYGPGAKQFGDLRLPKGKGPHPVAIILHGGCWQSQYNLDYIAHLGDQLARGGIATWNLEYRGIGDPGGAWPGTFEDVATGAEHLRTLAKSYPLDLNRVVLVGHSAGGHLALWLGARHRLPSSHPLSASAPLALRGVVTLAGIADLRDYGSGAGGCNKAVAALLGGSSDQVPERYAATSPSELLPVGVPMQLLIGAVDPIVTRRHNEQFVAKARLRGDAAAVTVIRGAGHFDLVLPRAPASKRVIAAIRSMLRAGRKS